MPFSTLSRLPLGRASWYVVWSKPVKAFWSRPKDSPSDWKKGMTEPGGKLADPVERHVLEVVREARASTPSR